MKKLSPIEKMLAASLAFTFLLLAIRVSIAHQTIYLFYVWNLFLAAIPLAFSRRLDKHNSLNFKSCLLLMAWLLFFPNAPYIITDIFHYENRPPLPMWFDLLLVLNAAWSGLMFGLCSLLQVELFLSRYLKPIWVSIYINGSLVLCGYGIYLGRFLRFNSWDVVTAPHQLFIASFQRIFNPFEHRGTWGFSLLFGISLILFYYTLKSFNKLSGEKNSVE